MLQHLPVYGLRAGGRKSFEEMLHRGRLYFLRIKPSNARSISGPRLIRSEAALHAIASACRKAQVRLALLIAPVNPRVSLYASADDKANFDRLVSGVAAQYDLSLFDFEDAVPAELWGRQFNSPDPLHLGRRGHQFMADRVVEALKGTLDGDR
jgi:lysophospholipase L1-like esterase